MQSDLVDHMHLGGFVYPDPVYIVVAADVLVPKVEAVHPSTTDPTAIFLLFSLHLPLPLSWHSTFVTKYAMNGEVIGVGVKIQTDLLDHFPDHLVLDILADFFCFPYFVVLFLVISQLELKIRQF